MQVSDMEIERPRCRRSQRLNEILARHTGQPIDRIALETERDRYFDAGGAKEFGLVDEVVIKK